jgi:hypothetical protein
MALYSTSPYNSGQYSAFYPGQGYYAASELTQPDHTNIWNDILLVDPLTKILKDYNPVFIDSLYEPRMAEIPYEMTFYSNSAHRLNSHYGNGVTFTGTTSEFSGIKYSSYLETANIMAGDFSIVFALSTLGSGMSHNNAGSATEKVLFQARSGASNLKIESYSTTGGLGAGDPAGVRLSLSDPSGVAVTGTKNFNDLRPHIVFLTRRLIDAQTASYSLYIDGALEASATASSSSHIMDFEDFGIGQWTGDTSWWKSPNEGQLSMSHLAIYDYAIPGEIVSGIGSVLSTTSGGGWHVLYQGRWYKVLI